MNGFLFLAKIWVKPMLTPNNAPPIAEKISPIEGALNMLEKSQPSPHKIKAPTKQRIQEMIVTKLGFSLIIISKVIGVAITEKDSKNVFLLVDVLSNPINWKRYAPARIIPATMQMRYDLLISLYCLVMRIKTTIANVATNPLAAKINAGE